ncbi:MAG TPA: PQQ-binding-like beta-propeller repeat protein [Prosthecobacter sp.]|nr:PQQ-binding-like beta-propeller repeat protein [Prosthecobacter sp.]
MKAAILLFLALPLFLQAGDWPRFLGPTGAAEVVEAKIPLTWSDTQNVAWKFAMPGPGSSSPIVVGNKVLVSCWSGYGDKSDADDMSKLQRHLVCLNLADGGEIWDTAVPATAPEDPFQGMITEHGYATSTPASDGERIYAFFGKSGAYAFDMDGKQLWHTPLGTESGGRRWGSGGSPILYKDTVIVNATDESRALYALDKKTGKQVWKASGGLLDMAYGTPSIMEANGRTDLVFALAEEVWGMNPDTGKLRWYALHQLPGNVSPCLVQDGNVAYLFGGFPTQGSVAVKLGGQDDVTATNVLWSSRTSSYVPTPILHEGHLYVVNDQGFAICMEAKTGKDVYRERVIESGGGRGRGKPFYASPVLIGDRLHCVSRKGGVYVIAAKPVYEKLAHNVLDSDSSQFNGTPAVANDRLILRSDWGVYCIAGEN